ncbi:MAG: phosphoribosylformylglycinamidine synthase subunit PurL [Rubrobacteraceae bacterium]|nr:phosphoribosylformylglycinamidine synthase subunit PurL [Rubrobacteraceae bacterium]
MSAEKTHATLGLSDAEYGRIVGLLGREPNFLELSLFSVMWSEHCGYKNSRPLLRRLPTGGERVLQGPGENAGVVELGEGWALAFKIESHNHPSAVEPYEGAATGVGGIIRDILALGARPVALLDSLRFGPPGEERSRYLFGEVVRGVGGYGNAIGVPTVGGELAFSPAYSGNPLVNVMCAGLVRTDGIISARASGEGNVLVLIGSKTGRDGIHGATFASDELSSDSEMRRSNVQVGDPFCGKMLIECCLELVRGGLLVALQDMGAAGITSSASEMAARGGVGVEVDVDEVPLREEGMEPHEIMLSESQERMLAVVEPEKVERVIGIAGRYGLVAAPIGRVAGHGELRVISGGEVAASVPASYLADAPAYEREVVRPAYLEEVRRFEVGDVPPPEDYGAVLLRMLSHPNLCSRRSVYGQYDHEVGTDTVVRPGADAAVMRVKGTTLGYALTTDGRGRHCYLDPEGGAASTVAEAYRNLSCVGARPLAVTDCLNFGNPEKPDAYYQLARCIEGMARACEVFGTPVVGGNVSLYNETSRGAIYPTPVVGMVGVMEDVRRHATPAFKREGDVVLAVGAPVEPSLAGSEYLEVIHGRVAGVPPEPDLAEERRYADLVRGLIERGLVDTAHDVSGGGEVFALAEMALAGGIGFEYEGDPAEGARPDVRLFGERGAGFLVALPGERLEEVERIAGDAGADCRRVGRTGGERFRVGALIDLSLKEMEEAYGRDLFGDGGRSG